MTVYAAGHNQLNYRVAGVCVHDGHILAQQMAPETIWALPGGRPALFEPSADALVRMTLPAGSPLLEIGRTHMGREGEVPLIFCWFPVDELVELPLYPEFLRTALRDIPETTVQVVHIDEKAPD